MNFSPMLKEKLRRLPHTSGVYLMKDSFGGIIYIGKAADLKRRVSHYFRKSSKSKAYNPKIASLSICIADFEYINTRSEAEALILESKLIKRWKPRYNTLEKDNKNFLLLRVEMFSDLPRFTFCRNRKDDNSLYFGPYLGTSSIRVALRELKKRFGILLSDSHPKKLEDGSWVLYDDARSEMSNFPNTTTRCEYMHRVNAALNYLRGMDTRALKDAKIKMKEASLAMNYEKAAKLRDLISAIEETRRGGKGAMINSDISKTSKEIAMSAIESLKHTFNLKKIPFCIECFDISHISGSFCVASMVRFENGEPARKRYRRFKIRSFVGNDDFRAMSEVVYRRYKRFSNEGQNMPDIVLIDGGKGQVYSALKAFAEVGITPPFIAGLAKREETVVLGDFSEKKLPRRHEGLRLLQRVRDEAHRFANSFSEFLRSQKIRESLLDDFPRLGKKRKDSLLAHFGSIAKIKKASIEELKSVEGIGDKTAIDFHNFLNANFRS